MATQQQWARLIAAAQQPTVADQQLLLEAVAVGMDTAPDVLGCTLTELDGQGGYRSVAASTELAAALDQAQFDAGNGPCLAAARDNQEKHIDSMAGDDRFPDFSGAAITRGVRSSLSLPLRGTRRPSSLNWYAADLAAFSSPRPRAIANLLARCTAGLLTGSEPATAAQVCQPDELQSALSQQQLVLRAQQALGARDQLSEAEAFLWLADQTKQLQVSIFEVARRLLVDQSEPA